MSIGILSVNNTEQFSKLQNQINESAIRLTTGKKINSAKDDAAGLAIVSRLEAISREFNVGVRNASDTISVLDTADSAVSGIQDGLQRLRELSVQSANGILSDRDRSAIASEANQIKAEINRVLETTSFNGRNILSEDQSFDVQLGGGESNKIAFSTQSVTAQLSGAGLNDIDLSTQAGANDAISRIDSLLDVTSNSRSSYGAVSNRLSSAVDNLSDRLVSVSSSQSRIEDTDYAAESVKLNRSLLLENAAIAVQAQANASAESVLSLLNT